MTAAGLTAVCAEIGARERPTVVECGSGYSTLRLAELVHARAGRLISLEHDASWAARVEDALVAAGLAETARIIHAPLEPHPLGRDGLPWYAEHALRSLPARIDVLLVDGPPAFEPGTGLSRYPALPALAERLAPDAVVILDDIDRPGELQVLHAWEHDTDFRFDAPHNGTDRTRTATATAHLLKEARRGGTLVYGRHFPACRRRVCEPLQEQSELWHRHLGVLVDRQREIGLTDQELAAWLQATATPPVPAPVVQAAPGAMPIVDMYAAWPKLQPAQFVGPPGRPELAGPGLRLLVTSPERPSETLVLTSRHGAPASWVIGVHRRRNLDLVRR